MAPKKSVKAQANSQTEKEDATKVKVVIEGLGQHLFFAFKRKTKLGKIMEVFSKSCGVSVNNLKFTFEGQEIRPEQTPELIGLETNDQIDVFQRSDSGASLLC